MNKLIVLYRVTIFIFVFFAQYFKLWKYSLINKTKLKLYPRLLDKTINTSFDRHYVYHVSWALDRISEKLNTLKISKHVDIGSSLFFVMSLANNHKVEFVDVRPPVIEHENLKLIEADVTNLPYDSLSLSSLSILHVIEHLGLGRYGDELDFSADIKAAKEISRVLCSGGFLFLVTPTGKPAVHFNAHRVYAKDEIIKMFNEFELIEFNFLKELDGGILKNPSIELISKEEYGCGFYIFEKK